MSTLSEYESKQRLAAAGVPTAPERYVTSADDAAAAATAIGFPVAVKLCGRAIAHKTERGLVRLGIRDAGAAREAAAALLAAAHPEDGEVGVLVSKMVEGKRELIAGCALDPTFGRCVMLGVGGIFAEVLADVVFRLAPLTRTEAEEMIDDLHNQKLLAPFRGEPAIDRGKLVDILVGLGEVATADERIVSIDVNPLIVSDGVPIAVDALIEVRE